MKRGQLITLFGITALPLALLPMVLAAQSSDANTSDDEVIEQIVVTGSLIKRSEESSQLFTNIDAEEIRLQGITTGIDLLATITQNSPSSRTSTTTATGGGLANFANLRALGAESTLTLVNGKRLVNSPLKHNAVDFNTMPMAMLQSVDILADGASSIYGSDAIAGVINFIMQDEVQGIHYYGYTLQPSDTGGEVYAGSLSAGFGSLDSEGWNFSLGGTWREREKILNVTREYAKTAVIPERGINFLLRQSFPANVSQIDPSGGVIINNANPYPECNPPETVPFRGACGYDADASGSLALQNPEEQASFIGRFATLLGSAELSFEYLWAQSTISSGIAPTTYSGVQVPITSPYFPGAGTIPDIPGLDPTLPIVVASRWNPGGRRTTENDTETDRFLAQIEGGIGKIDYEVWALHSTSTAKLSMLDGAYLRTEFDAGFAGVNGVFLNPFGAATPEEQEYLDGIRVTGALIDAEGTLTMAGITLGYDLFELSAGAVSTALAFEYAEEDVDYVRDELANMLRGGVVGGDQTVSGDRDRYSITGEVLIPVTDRFEINASVRFDDYSDFGTTTNPKVLLSYDVSDAVNLHGSYNTGFRAPTLFNIFTPSTLSFIVGTLYDDPVLCPGGIADTANGGIDIRDCGQRPNSLLGGNKDLGPEESEAYAIGIDIQAGESLAFRLDYWNYELDQTIGPLSHPAIFGDPDRFSSFLVRCSEADPSLAAASVACTFVGGGGDPLAYVVQTNANLGKTKTSGIDFAASWYTDTGIGSIGVDYRATYVDNYEFERVPGDPTFSRAGLHFDGYPVPRYTHYLALNWANNDWSAQLQNQFMSGYEDCNSQCGIADEFFNNVDDYAPWNLTATYVFSKAITVTAHVKNLFDEDPPFSNGGILCTGCDIRFADPTGQAIGVSVLGSFEF